MNFEDELLDLPIGKRSWTKTRSISVLIFIFLNICCLILGFFFSLIEIESIIFSGGTMIVLSFTLLVLSLAQKKWYLLPQSLLGLGIVAFIFLFIALKELSPSEAKKPVPALLLMFGIFYLLPFSWSLYKEFRLRKKV